jgi:hypothetical protein
MPIHCLLCLQEEAFIMNAKQEAEDPKEEAAKHVIEGTLIVASNLPLYCPWCGGHATRATKKPLTGWTWDCFGGCNP